MRTVLALLGNDDAKVKAVLDRIDEAERKADRRGVDAEKPAPTPAPANG